MTMEKNSHTNTSDFGYIIGKDQITKNKMCKAPQMHNPTIVISYIYFFADENQLNP